MSRVGPVQTSFNGGEISRRLSARIDQSIYGIAVEEMTGWAPLLEGPAEAMPGFIHVAQAPEPVRLFRFEYNSTQGHVIEAGATSWRAYTNDALIIDGGAPVTVASPYTWAEIEALRTHQNYDVMYCLLRSRKTKKFRRDGATAFSFADLELENGPFEDRNQDKTLKVSASALSGSVNLGATSAIFAATDVGSLFQMEAGDFGDIPAWEPGITVTLGQLLTFGERVYRVAGLGAASRTGGLQPVHTDGIEWDGTGRGTDVNDKDAAGVQLEYVHDKIGILRITGFTDSTHVAATVLRRLPFSSVNNNYDYTGGYYTGGFGAYAPSGASYAYGTWRWRFGAFSDTRGWPESACVWNERLWLSKDETVYGSAAADLENFAVFNELGELTNDMALTVRLPDPEPIQRMVGDDKLLIVTTKGLYALGPAGAATGIGPNNRRVDMQNNRSSGPAEPVQLDSRVVYIDRSGKRIHEADFDVGRNSESAVELTRFARHLTASNRRFTALAAQSLPFNHLWALREDGTLACAVYLPEERALGWANRSLASGMLAKSLCAITDPAGENEQIWIAATYGGNWHVLRMAAWRDDGAYDLTPTMLDMAASYDGAPIASFTHPVLRSRAIDVVADGAWYSADVDAGGVFTLQEAASRVVAGLPYAARMTGMPIESGGDNGPARGKTARIGAAWVEVETSRGLRFGAAGEALEDLEGLTTDTVMDEGFAVETGFHDVEAAGDYTRRPRLAIERVAPFQATVLAWGSTLEVAQK